MRDRKTLWSASALIAALILPLEGAGSEAVAGQVKRLADMTGNAGPQASADLVPLAATARWVNDRGEVLPFPGNESDERGFARLLTCRLAGMPSDYDNVLMTHPRWAANGSIEGIFSLTVPPESVFRATVGFREGAVGTDGVTFEVRWGAGSGSELLARRRVSYGKPGQIVADLSRFGGRAGDLVLRVLAGSSSSRDWAVWLFPKIDRRMARPEGKARDVTDRDRDGIPDAVERRLLDRFSPMMLFTRGEKYRPCDAIWYVRHSSLKPEADEGASSVLSREDLNADPSKLLTAAKPGGDWGPSDLTANPKRTRYGLNPTNEHRDGFERGDGFDWSDIFRLRNVGLYGHVVPWQGRYQISYWQFYGYSDTEGPLDIGDHEGDWESIHLVVDSETEWIVQAVHCAHGYEMVFDFSLQGVNRHRIASPVGEMVEFRGPNYDTSNFNIRTNAARRSNNLVRFCRDPQTGEYTHPVVYVERGSHGSWPSEHWTFKIEFGGRDYGAPPHSGDINPYLTGSCPNLGEVEDPASEEARIILRYNGRWGAYEGHANAWAGTDSPPGPSLHWQWVWPDDSLLKPRIPDNSFSDGRSIFRHR